MSATDEKSQRELRVFREFVQRSGLAVVPGSVEVRCPPEPDIRCEIDGAGYIAVELKELCDSVIPKTIDHQLKHHPEQSIFMHLGPGADKDGNRKRGGILKILDDTLAKEGSYKSDHPIELLFYTAGRLVETPREIIPEIRSTFGNNRNQFHRVWFMGEPGEICQCVVQA